VKKIKGKIHVVEKPSGFSKLPFRVWSTENNIPTRNTTFIGTNLGTDLHCFTF
jgi:hypothetical protein